MTNFAVFVTVCLAVVSAHASSQQQRSERYRRMTKDLPVVDALISRLLLEQWGDDTACRQATLDMLDGVKNNTLWATWLWDSMQLPAGSLYGVQAYFGNYDQCLQAPWSSDQRHPGLRSQYCLVDVKGPATDQIKTFGPFDDTEEFYQTPTKDGRRFNLHYFGVCLPSICSTSSVAKISQHLIQLTHLPDGNVTVDPRNCETAGVELEYSAEFYAFWAVVGTLVAIVAISTFFNTNDTRQTDFGTLTQSFCAKQNYRKLFIMSRDEVKVMHGMRFITAVLIIYIHEGFFAIGCPVVNALDLNKFITSSWGLAMMHLEIVVDTFFAMSGLLLVRGLMIGKQKNLFYVLVKRYIRLIGPFVLCIMYFAMADEHMSRGPVWKRFVQWETDACVKYWWKSLLVANTDVATTCHSVTWYISCDFQLAILGTALFWLFRKNRKLGVGAFVATAVALTMNLGFTVYWKQLDILPFNYRILKSAREFPHLNDTYFSSRGRAGPYLVGMVMGYIIAAYKPAEHRNVIGKKWSRIIVAVSLLVAVTMLAIGGIFAGRSYDPLESAVVVATNRVFWGVAICAIIGVCEYGSLSLIPSLLGWPGFVPLSKLSYGIYLLHTVLQQLLKLPARTPLTYSPYNSIINTLGVLVLTCGLSLVMYLVLEAPFINISNGLFTKSPLKQNGTRVKTINNGNSEQSVKNGHKFKSI